MSEEHLLIVGASVRAAAFSALRAGLKPWCVDLFADADLAVRCPARALPAKRYPQGLVDVLREAPPGPWMYTGALENRPRLIGPLARRRPLWGNNSAVLRRVRSPYLLIACLKAAGLAHARLRRPSSQVPRQGRWLAKPRDGAGGRGIAFCTPGEPSRQRRGRWYVQEHIEGEPSAAVYVGDGTRVRLLGLTRQLIGEPWLHAAPFHYCGSIGPLMMTTRVRHGFRFLGRALVEGFRLRGLFGVDCVMLEGLPYPVEVNPRYTASVELLEYASGTPALALHRRVFEPGATEVAPRSSTTNTLGKAILFARETLDFPADGPWMTVLRRPADPWQMPAFADIPHAGTRIEAGHPVLTLFARAASVASCLDSLRHIALDLDRWLFS